MRDNNNEYQSMKMNRATQAVVLENVVALKIRYHVFKFVGALLFNPRISLAKNPCFSVSGKASVIDS
jgi:hypothetical protein